MNDELIENINMLNSQHLWQRQIAAIKLGEIGDIRAVSPLMKAYSKEEIEEVKQAIEKALEQIAKKNGFENAEQLKIVATRTDKDIEEITEINQENYEKYISIKQIKSPRECIGQKCIFYEETDEKEEVPCGLRYYLNKKNKQKNLIYSIALETNSTILFKTLQELESCQDGYSFMKDAITATIELEKAFDKKNKKELILSWFLLALGIEEKDWGKEIKKWNAVRIKETLKRLEKIKLRDEVKDVILETLEKEYELAKEKRNLEKDIEKINNEIEALEKQLKQKSLFGFAKKKKKKEEIKKQLYKSLGEKKQLENKYSETKKEVKKATRSFREAQKILKYIQ